MSTKSRNIIIAIVVIVVVILLFVRSFFKTYDRAIALQENVTAKWANVESSYQRRSDLIPNLVNTVKGYATHEEETFEKVVEARAKATQVTVNPQNLDAASIQNFQEAQAGLSSALSRLLVVAERYPDLKANQNFLELQAQLEGTENRINVARNDYNAGVQDYNAFIRGLYRRWALRVAGGDFKPKQPFVAQQGTEVAPSVQF